MDQSYIIRIYKQENDTASGIVENVEKSKRTRFNNASQLWSLITCDANDHEISNVIESNIYVKENQK